MPTVQPLEQETLIQQTLQQAFHQQVHDLLAMPIPSVPVPIPEILTSTVPTPVQTELAPSMPVVVSQQEAASASMESSQAPRRYVPPSGAGLPPRRRVAYRLPPRRPDNGDDSP